MMHTTFKSETSSTAIPAIWRIDPAASRVAFTTSKRLFFVKDLTVTGHFADVRGTIALDEDEPVNARADVTIGAASVSTHQGKRDAHLLKADFFDVKRHPLLTFRSRHIEAIDRAAGRYRVTGDLTIRDVTREVILDAEYTPPQRDTRKPRISVTLTTLLNRRDFGIVWNMPVMKITDEIAVAITIAAAHT